MKDMWIKDKRYVKFIKSMLTKPCLDVGCGYDKMGDMGMDIDGNPDIKWDLNEFPYPVGDGSFRSILCHHVLEHLKCPQKTLDELHRILELGGMLIVIVPHPNHPTYYNPAHIHFFDEESICDMVSKHFTIIDKLKWRGTEWMPFPVFVHKLLGKIYPSQIICMGVKEMKEKDEIVTMHDPRHVEAVDGKKYCRKCKRFLKLGVEP